MFKRSPLARVIGATLLVSAAGGLQAAPIVLSGNFISLTLSDDGTLGNGGTSPGLIYDPTGTGSFDPNNDYIAPGTPFEGFGVRSDQTGLIGNRNSSSGGAVGGTDAFNQNSITDTSSGSVRSTNWTGTSNDGLVSISHSFSFDVSQERVDFITQITANSNLTNLTFARAVDPDPDSRAHGTAQTINQRGFDENNDGDFLDPQDLAQEDFVTSSGSVSGLPLGLFSDSGITHNTGIMNSCCSVIDPLSYLSGGDFPGGSTGDDGIGIGFDIGSLLAGQSVTIGYSYVMGLSVEDIDVPVAVPTPAGLALMFSGLLGLGFARRNVKR